MGKIKEVITSYVITNICKWCHGRDPQCLHCLGTGDHDYRSNGKVTYKAIKARITK